MHEVFAPSRGFISFFRGDTVTARRDLAAYAAAIEPFELPASLPIPNHPLPIALSHLAFAEALAGELTQARATSDRAVEVAAALPFPRGPFSLCYVYALRSAIEFLASNVGAAHEFSNLQGDLAKRHGYTVWILIQELQGEMINDAVGVEGASERAVAIIDRLRAMGAAVWSPMNHAGLAQIKIIRGDLPAAMRQVERAAAVAEATGIHFWSPEIRRLEGLVALAEDHGSPQGLELCRDAARLAAEQGASTFELRARLTICQHTDDADEVKALARLLEPDTWAGLPEAVEAQRLVGDRL
jgi:hypothetical protein